MSSQQQPSKQRDAQELPTFKSYRSKRFKKLQSMDLDGDGIISPSEAVAYSKSQHDEIKKYKKLFCLLLVLLLVFVGILFGLLIVAFNLTKQIETHEAPNNSNQYQLQTNENNDNNNNNYLVSTMTGYSNIEDITRYFASDFNEQDIVIRWVRGYFDDIYIFSTISHIKKIILPTKYESLIMKDNSGYITFEYYYNKNISINQLSQLETNNIWKTICPLIMKEKLNNGSIITRYFNPIKTANELGLGIDSDSLAFIDFRTRRRRRSLVAYPTFDYDSCNILEMDQWG